MPKTGPACEITSQSLTLRHSVLCAIVGKRWARLHQSSSSPPPSAAATPSRHPSRSLIGYTVGSAGGGRAGTHPAPARPRGDPPRKRWSPLRPPARAGGAPLPQPRPGAGGAGAVPWAGPARPARGACLGVPGGALGGGAPGGGPPPPAPAGPAGGTGTCEGVAAGAAIAA